MNTRHLCTFEGARGGEILHRIQSYGKFRPRERSEEHTSELQSQSNLVCRLLLEKKKKSTVLSNGPETSIGSAPKRASLTPALFVGSRVDLLRYNCHNAAQISECIAGQVGGTAYT